MEFRDLKAQYLNLKNEIDSVVHSVLSGGQYIFGRPVEELEESLADYTNMKHCITCANGTDALQLALMAMEIGKGDAVIVPDFTFFASAEAVAAVGAKPIFAEVDARTFNLDAEKLEKTIQSHQEKSEFCIKAVMAVDIFGQPADYGRIKKICQQYDLLLLEDGAQGFGGRIGNQMACSFGDIGTTSFFPAKPLGCYGDGGAVFTNSEHWAELLRSYRVHGKGENKYDNVRIGMNSRLDTIQAAILKVKLKAFQDYELKNVNVLAAFYTNYLSEYVKTPLVKEGYQSSWAQYSILLENKTQRDKLQEYLKRYNIPTMIYYPRTMSDQTAFAGDKAICPIAQRSSQTILSLPIGPYLSENNAEYVSEAVIKFLEK